MRIRKLEIRHVALPLKKAIKHASHERTVSDSLIVCVTLENGTQGYGEGVPRSYVTGETIDTGFEMLAAVDLAQAVGSPSDFGKATRFWLSGWTLPSIAEDPRGMHGNAARCALELATLDAYGRHFGAPIGDVLKDSPLVAGPPHKVRYSGAITAEGERKERISAWKMRLYGFHQVKVKVGVPGQDDPARLARFRKILGPRVDIRLDANEAWHSREATDTLAALLPHRPSLIEQPLPHEQVECLAELRPRLGLPVMLDESLCGFPDGERAVRLGLADLFNVRISKCGGLIPTLGLIEMASDAGLSVQIGCHPGESGLLSAAGRHLASRLATTEVVRYLEGSYDRHVLADNIIREDVTFGYGGRAKPIDGPGLGVTIDRDALERLTVRRTEVSFD